MMLGVILYGPPAAGKDTVTRELTTLEGEVHLFSRVKAGSGRTESIAWSPMSTLMTYELKVS